MLQAEPEPSELSTYNLRTNRSQTSCGKPNRENFDYFLNQFHNKVCLAQMSAKKGIREFGSAAVKALMQEYQQLDDLDVLKPIKPNTLT